MPTALPTGFSWRPPDSPDSPEYTKLLAYVDELKRQGRVKEGMAWFAAACEADFWLWQWKVMSLGRLKIKDPGHKRQGRLWVMERWFFDRMREVQQDFDSGATDILYQWSRFMFKSSAVQKGGSLWFLGKNRSETILILTHREDKTGAAFGKDFQTEIEGNKVLLDHWPQFRNLQENTKNSIVVDRPPGVREPSIAIYGILSSAASGHFTKIFVDDGVHPEETSRVVFADIDNRISLMTFVQSQETQRFWIGVPVSDDDPIEKRRKAGGFFTRVSRHPGILPGGVYPMRSKRFFDNWKRTALEHHFQSQVMLSIIPPGMVFFRQEWLRRYAGRPEVAAQGCRIHIVLDPAGGRRGGKKLSDFLIVRVVAFGFDRRRRNLDLWRERVGMTSAYDLLLGPMPGEDTADALCLKVPNLERGLVAKWRRYDPNLTVWIEEVGETQFCAALRKEMRFRRLNDPAVAVSCVVRELRSNMPKENRIARLQPDYRNGMIEYPLGGFGHPSFTTEDRRDTLDQFIEDEFKTWTLAGEIPNDDMLDSEAWGSLPGISMPYPEEASGSEEEGFFGESSLAGGGREGPSWRVA